MIAATYWALGEFFVWQVRTPESIRFWLRASAFWPMVIAVFFHFITVFCDHPLTKDENSWILGLGIYAPSLAVSLIGLLTNDLDTLIFQQGSGYVYTPDMGSFVYLLGSGTPWLS